MSPARKRPATGASRPTATKQQAAKNARANVRANATPARDTPRDAMREKVHTQPATLPAATTKPETGGPVVLVVDVGGTHIKLRASDWEEQERVDSGPHLDAAGMVRAVRDLVGRRHFDVVAMGYPGVVKQGNPAHEPVNLAAGWVGFDFAQAFGAPTRIINDALMQALGNYESGHMLFIGYGTGMGSAMVTEKSMLPLELAHLPYRKGRTYEEYVGAAGRERMGDEKWEKHCLRVAVMLREGLQATDVVLGGGNSKRLREIPEGMRLGSPDAAFLGGRQLWKR